MNFANTVKYC